VLEVRFVDKDGELLNFFKGDEEFLVDKPDLKDEYIKNKMQDAGIVLTVTMQDVKIRYPLDMFGYIEVYVKPSFGYDLYRFVDGSCGCGTTLADNNGTYIVSDGDVPYIGAEFLENGETEVLPGSTNLSMTLDGVAVYTDSPAYIDIKNSRTMVPVRFISQALGAAVKWDEASGLVSVLSLDGSIIELSPGTPDMIIKKDGSDPTVVKMDIPATITNGRTYVPVRYVAEALGLTVDWDNETKTVMFKM
jgi:hypothetical protein